uniref:helix-turn-helix domain-containing protein n=1 Tax=Actinacidiphila guanduensis TaxID=310781 RepID=UPI001FE24896|nr:helix-turn-helix domain-containing protein [Actinacidiphila guanduensis]
MQAVDRFQCGDNNREIAAALRVSERSVERRRRAWRASAADPVSCRRARQVGLGSAKPRSPRRKESWSVARWPTAGWTSDGRCRGSGR